MRYSASWNSGMSCQALQVDVGDFSKGIKLHFGVRRGGRDTAMPELVANLLHRQALVEEMLRRCVALRMRTATLAGDAEAIKIASDDVRYRGPAQRLERGVQRQEQRSLQTRGTNLAEIAHDRLSDTARERIEMRPPGLGAAHTRSVSSSQSRSSSQSPVTSLESRPQVINSIRIARSRRSAARSPSVVVASRRAGPRRGLAPSGPSHRGGTAMA